MTIENKPLGITMGDPSGIGPEIVVKTLSKLANEKLVVIGDAKVIKEAICKFAPSMQLNTVTSVCECNHRKGVVNLIESSDLNSLPPYGLVNSDSGKAAFDAIKKAISLAIDEQIFGIVTAPINKESLSKAGIKYPGHTEILAEYSSSNKVAMMLANEEIRTVLVTIHCSLKDAIEQADYSAQLETIDLAHNACLKFGIKSPRIAVAGLNPHAGENGLFGDEEIKTIIPAIEEARSNGLDVSGPWPGDTVFMQARQGKFDVVVAQYHDQGLIPVKYMGIEEGVNITLGLPFVRTSPDHGTAFDIAGRGIADERSIEASIRMALKMKPNKEDNPMNLDFIFMLTENDKTISDAMNKVEEVLEGGAKHIGFKDIGLPFEELKKLASRIKQAGAKLYLEVVSLDEESEIRSAKAAMDLNVDFLMGGTRAEVIAPIVKNHPLKYYPFPGKIVDHPSILEGTIEEIVESAKYLTSIDGVDGLDLLAYRFKGDVPQLMQKVCQSVSKPVVVAGSIDSQEQIIEVYLAKASGFTVGTAAFNETFPARKSGLEQQVNSINTINNYIQLKPAV